MSFSTFIPLLLFLSIFANADSVYESPNQKYSAIVSKGEFQTYNLTIKHNKKILYTTSSGYGKYEEVKWSPNSLYLAVIERGTKTTTNLSLYSLNEATITRINLPDFRLNILGRFNKTEGGRYQFVKSLKWSKNSTLDFLTSGSLLDGTSDPVADPENWYHYRIKIRFNKMQSKLLLIERHPRKKKEWEEWESSENTLIKFSTFNRKKS